MQNRAHNLNAHSASQRTRSPKQAGPVMLLSSLFFTACMAVATGGITWWLSERWSAHLAEHISPLDLLASLFFLLDAVAIIRLVCFAAMLLSPARQDEALDLMPTFRATERLRNRLRKPNPPACRRIGLAVLLQASGLSTVVALCVRHLIHLR